MPIYHAPVQDSLFLLNHVFSIDQYQHLEGFAEATPDMVEAILSEGARLCEETLLPLNQSGDQEGCTLQNGTVSTPKGFKEAYDLYKEGGWIGLSGHPDYGGQGLPIVLNSVMQEYISSANLSWGMYPGLSQGAYSALFEHGSEEQKALYLPKLLSGEWAGTMNLTEPHCGTDLGLIKTKAIPQSDGSYQISGQKIFISSGDHDLTNNIVHLVLARIEGAPEGTKGISLFVVPKVTLKADGTLGARNGVSCGSLEEKMGIHGNATCVLNFDKANGWLVGEENKGLPAMFVMMNEARLAVGIQGLAVSEAAYQNAVIYAKERVQGRALTGAKNPDGKADPILVHPDVRRMLLTVKSFNEAARALVIWAALKADQFHRSQDEAERQNAEDQLGLLTPVIKGVLSDTGFANTVLAQQVFGGHGYVKEWGMEQFVRDARITMMYEGANGIQALDLVGRKLPKDGGRALKAFFAEIDAFLKENEGNDALTAYISPIKKARDDLQAATLWFMKNAIVNPDHAGAGSHDYMHLLGLVALGFMWGKMAKTAQETLKQNPSNKAFYEAKLLTGQYFMERILPETAAHLARISSGADTLMQLPADAF